MRRLYVLIVLLICLGSCQQRYRHVKKVKSDKTPTADRKEKEQVQADSGFVQSYFNTSEQVAPGLGEVQEERRETAPSAVPEKEDAEIEKQLNPGHKPKLKAYFKQAPQKLFPQKYPSFDPLTGREILLIMAIFIIALVLLGFIFGLLTGLLTIWVLILLLWGSLSELFLFLIIIMAIGLIYLIVTFFIARRIIRKKLQKDLTNFELLSHYLLLLGAIGFLYYLSLLTVPYLVTIAMLIAFILALIYVALY